MATIDETRRRFMAHFAGIGLGTTLAPGILWARMQDAGAQKVTLPMVSDALALAGIDMTEAERTALVEGANRNLTALAEIRAIHIPNDVSPPFHFSAIVPGVKVDRAKQPFRLSAAPAVKRPANLEDVAFWPVRHLAELVRTRQVTSVELTQMYLARLHRYNPLLNNVVTFLDDHGLAEARRADAEIAAGKYKGPLHGIPWGAKDIISVKGFKTTWGSPAFKEQVFDYDASVVEMLRDAGAVLIAKVATGELAGGDNWFGGQTKNPWDPTQGSSGSSAGPSSATAAGCIGVRHRQRDERVDPEPGLAMRARRPASHLRAREPLRRDGAVVDPGSARARSCRYAEDCAHRHAGDRQARRPRHERVGHPVQLERAARRPEAQGGLHQGVVRRAHQRVGEGQRGGDARDVPRPRCHAASSRCRCPTISTNTSAINVERAAFFDEHARAGRMKEARGGQQANGRLVSAPDYLQSQRVRMMMMQQLAEATAHVDVYIVASNNSGASGPGPSGWRRRAGRAAGRRRIACRRPRSATRTWRISRAIPRSTCRTASVRPAVPPTPPSSRSRSERWRFSRSRRRIRTWRAFT